MVGHYGEAVGVDPDEVRIKVAQEKFKDEEKVKFLVGNSVTGIPRDNNEYCDLHFSPVFNWIVGKEKKLYIWKAYHCLKHDGRIAVDAGLNPVMPATVFRNLEEFLGEEQYKQLVEDDGQFINARTNIVSHINYFAPFREFAAWFKVSTDK